MTTCLFCHTTDQHGERCGKCGKPLSSANVGAHVMKDKRLQDIAEEIALAMVSSMDEMMLDKIALTWAMTAMANALGAAFANVLAKISAFNELHGLPSDVQVDNCAKEMAEIVRLMTISTFENQKTTMRDILQKSMTEERKRSTMQ